MNTFGTEAFKLVRKNDPSTSHAAAESVNTTHLEQLVYETIKGYGVKGCIADNVLGHYRDMPYSSITARFSGLERKGFIVYPGEKRKGKSGRYQRVMVAV